MNIRPATAQDFAQQFTLPRQTVKAWVVEENDRLLGIGGYYLEHGRAVIFSEIANDARTRCQWPARAMLTSARHVLAEALKIGVQVCAVADPKVKNSAKLLERLGFVQGYKETYVWAPPD